jgi:hypothetical protein
MWPWIKRWRDWAMNELWPLSRIGLANQTLHFSYEKAGLVLNDQPIPWNAETVLLEGLVRLPTSAGRRKADFGLRLPGQPPYAVEHLRCQDNDERYRITFRIPPPGATVTAELLYRERPLGQVLLPFVSREDFLQGLRLQMPTLYVRLGEQSVACQTFVSSQCKGLLASALVTSPTSLVPLVDLDLQVEFHCERDGKGWRVPASLCSSQLAGRQALLTVAPHRPARRTGVWIATWLLGDRVLATQRVRAISEKLFQRSLRISDTRFVVQTAGGRLRLSRQPPVLDGGERVGPCFLVSSSHAGMAGLVRLGVTAQVPGTAPSPQLLQQEVLITDGPTMVAPGTLDPAQLAQAAGFELRVGNRALGSMSLCPAPAAAFTSEGGFKPPQDYRWTAAAEEEMTERLNRLFEGE